MFRAFILALVSLVSAHAGTLAIFETRVGDKPVANMYLDLYDADKPATVRNFIRYVETGRFDNMIVQRWDPAFVIQGGGYYVDTNINHFRPVQTFGTITNEYSVGRTFSNTYGTIAMARQGGKVHSATSQWFINLTNNVFLDSVDEGFTVFGKVILGTNVLNQFHPETVNNDLKVYQVCANACQSAVLNPLGEPIYLPELPALAPANPGLDDLVYIDVRFVEASIAVLPSGAREISWNSVSGVINRVGVRTPGSTQWSILGQVTGNGNVMKLTDNSPQTQMQQYRIRLNLF